MKYLPKYLVIPLLLFLLNGLLVNADDFGEPDTREDRSRPPRVQVQVLWRYTGGLCRWVNSGDTQTNGWQVADDSTCVNDPPAPQNAPASQEESGSVAPGTESSMRARGFVLWRYTGGLCRWVNPDDTQANGWQVADATTCVNDSPTTQNVPASQEESSSVAPGMGPRGFVLWRYTGGLCRWVNPGDTQANGWQVADATTCTRMAP